MLLLGEDSRTPHAPHPAYHHALIGLPKEWSQDQIHGFQKHFDGVLAGNSALLRRVHFMPGDFKYQETKAPPLKDAYDEFIARIICF